MLAGGKSTYQRLVKPKNQNLSKTDLHPSWNMDLLVLGCSWYSCIAYKWKVKMQSRSNQSSKILVRTLFIPRLEMNRSATNRFSTSLPRNLTQWEVCWFIFYLPLLLVSCVPLFLLVPCSCFPFISVLFLLLPVLFPFACCFLFYPFFMFCSLLSCCLFLLLASLLLAWSLWDTLNLFPPWHRKCSRAD